MSYDLATIRGFLSEAIDDNWASTTTSSGSSTTIKDTALTEKAADWVSDGTGGRVPTTVHITSGTHNGQEREVTSLSSDTITVDRAFGGTIGSEIDYEIHRQFTATEKDNAIYHACMMSFPDLYVPVHDESITFGNWLRNGGFDVWTSSSNPDYWTESVIAATEETSIEHVHRGGSSCKLTRSGTDGYIYQDETLVRDLWDLEEQSTTFYAWVKSDVASQVRLAILDGTTTTYSDYHDGDSTWRELSVSATIAEYATGVEFRIYVESDDTVCYVDDARVVGVGGKYSYDISDLSLVNNQPHQVHRIIDDERPRSIWQRLYNWEPPTTDSRLHFRSALPDETKIRITGMRYIFPPTASGNEYEVGFGQKNILIAEAAIYLCDLAISRSTTANIDRYLGLRSVWERKSQLYRNKFRMPPPSGTILH